MDRNHHLGIFLQHVQALASAALSSQKESATSDQIHAVAKLLAHATALFPTIPVGMSLSEAAADVVTEHLPVFEDRFLNLDYRRPDWLPPIPTNWSWIGPAEEEHADGRWLPLRRRWHDLSDKEGVHWAVMALLKTRAGQSAGELATSARVRHSRVETALADLERLRAVTRVEGDPDVWCFGYGRSAPLTVKPSSHAPDQLRKRPRSHQKRTFTPG